MQTDKTIEQQPNFLAAIEKHVQFKERSDWSEDRERAAKACAAIHKEAVEEVVKPLRDEIERRWISVEDRKPTEKGFYLCFFAGQMDVLWYNSYDKVFQIYNNSSCDWDDINGEFWMPLPNRPAPPEQ